MSQKLVILIGGAAGHGKDSLANYLKKILSKWAPTRTDAYAWALKQCVHLKTGIPMDILLAPKDVKESYIDPLTGRTVRKLLQDEGETTRQEYGHLVWAHGTMMRAKFSTERVSIITDARHPKEELHWMKEQCSEFARVFTVRIRRSSVPIKRGHPSEDLIADEPDSTFDFIIENEGDLEELKAAAIELARACVFLQKTGKKKVNRKGDGWGVPKAIAYEPLTTEKESTFLSEPVKLTYLRLKGESCV